jgi:predicted amino acid dehydrogenase
VPAKKHDLERLAEELRAAFGYRGDIEIVAAHGAVPAAVYASKFIIGATNVPGVLEVERLSPGSVVVDDSFPHCFDLDRAVSRMSSGGDVLLVEGGLVSPPGPIEWTITLPAGIATILGPEAEASLLPASGSITGCILSSLLAEDGVAATAGPVTVAACRDHWQALERMRIGAAPLVCGRWSPGTTYFDQFGYSGV